MRNFFRFFAHLLDYSSCYRILTACAVLVVSYYSIVPPDQTPAPSVWDKAQHFIAYFVIAGGVYFSRLGLGIWKMLLLVTLYSAMMEVAQYFVPDRFLDIEDLFANALGAVCGVMMALGLERMLGRLKPTHS